MRVARIKRKNFRARKPLWCAHLRKARSFFPTSLAFPSFLIFHTALSPMVVLRCCKIAGDQDPPCLGVA